MLLIGLCIIPIIILIIKRLSAIKIKKSEKIILHSIMLLISITFIILCFVVNQEPFNPEINEPSEYILYSAIIYLFTPFLWIVTIYYARKIFKNLRIKKNSIIKKDEEYIYYRDDLNKVSPGIVMFTSMFDVDFKKSISATILKLKLTDYIRENNGTFEYTNKDENDLLESEKMVLNLVRFNKFDKSLYKKTVEKEAIKYKYVRKNRGGILGRIIKIICIIIVAIIFYNISSMLDHYVFKNYHIWPEDDGKKYVTLKNEDEIENLYYNEIKDEKDYYGRIILDLDDTERMSYNYNMIRADKLEYSVVRKAIILNFLVPISIAFCIVWAIISIYKIIEEIIYINKNYKRTLKGNELLNKVYSLKNYLNDYSLIKNRKEEEIVLWEYYLVYAVVLDVNVKIQDEIIQKYIKEQL